MKNYLISTALVGAMALTACGGESEATDAAASEAAASQAVYSAISLDDLRQGLGAAAAAFLVDAESECGARPLGFESGAITSADLNGDGQADYLVDLSRMTCGGEPSGNGWCGSGGCSFDIYTSTGASGYRQDAYLGMEPEIIRFGDGLGVGAIGRNGPWTVAWNGAQMDIATAPASGGEQAAAGDGDEAAVRAVVASIYDAYVADDESGQRVPDDVETAELQRAVEAASDPEMGGLGFDYYCACQDYGDVSYDITGVAVSGDQATVALDFRSFGQMTQMELRLRKVGRRWQVDDVIDPNGSLRDSLQGG